MIDSIEGMQERIRELEKAVQVLCKFTSRHGMAWYEMDTISEFEHREERPNENRP